MFVKICNENQLLFNVFIFHTNNINLLNNNIIHLGIRLISYYLLSQTLQICIKSSEIHFSFQIMNNNFLYFLSFIFISFKITGRKEDKI